MDVIEVTQDLVSHNSASKLSNAGVSKAVARWMRKAGMKVERVEYRDPDGVTKVNVVGLNCVTIRSTMFSFRVKRYS